MAARPAQLVVDQWGGTELPSTRSCARKGFAVFAVDNRGTPDRDRKFQTAIRHQFGAIELKDQLARSISCSPQYPQLDTRARRNLGMVGTAVR